MDTDVAEAVRLLAERGVLLVQDAALPSLATLVAGGPVKGSWWSHPKAQRIFETLGALDDRDDVVSAKLVDGKVTLVHARLFAALAAVGAAREAWQIDGLGAAEKKLLGRVDAARVRASGADAKALELRLLVVGRQVHTENGKHELELSSWAAFRAQHALAAVDVDAAKREIEAAVGDARDRLPWVKAPRAPRPRAPRKRR